MYARAGIRMAISIAAFAALTACAKSGGLASGTLSPTRSASSSSPRGLYEANATVLESNGRPMLCLGVVLGSLPPQCGDVPLVGWDWSRVDGEEMTGGVTWGAFHVVGSFDGTTLTVTDAGPVAGEPKRSDEIPLRCETPVGGWTDEGDAPSTEDGMTKAIAKARAERDFAGAWLYTLEDGDIVLHLAFTGSLDAHRARAREDWGGPLCLVEFERTYAELTKIQAELTGDAARDLDLDVLVSAPSEFDNLVRIDVIVAHPDTQARLDARYGKGVVEVTPRLRLIGS